jgi:hypothetical protein
VLATVAAIVNEAIRHIKQSREVYSLHIDDVEANGDAGESKGEIHLEAFILGSVLWSAATIGAIYWLWRISTIVPAP